MGFSLFCPLGSHTLLGKHRNGGFELQRSSSLLRRDVGFSFLKHETCPQSRAVLCRCEPADFEERKSANEVRKEIERCYDLINNIGRGVVYLGSSRMGPDHLHYSQAFELAREASATTFHEFHSLLLV
ncbi:hypothetical protein CRG98_029115 [Punica granatum]|uniref:Uncharacterized protein n=1 Tax=Punica granatum TaxID=22663 RepID=A0A2I0J3J8_PUNGR|nr:hypothetical protein CRG98_029115 [Punica granatum]